MGVMERQDTVDELRRRLQVVIGRTGLSRSAFARKVGVDRSTLSQILAPDTSRLPRLETLTAIAASEQVSIDWLAGLSQEGGLGTDILDHPVEIQSGGVSPVDERLQQWHTEAIGTKIRYVPSNLPDLLKTDEVIDHEYQEAPAATPAQRRATTRARLAYQRRPETDMEVCSSHQSVEELARGEGIWRDLARKARRRQLARMAGLCDELYPTFRWFLFDGRSRFAAPMTVFGPVRVAIYLGGRFLVLNSREIIAQLTRHFDGLIRAAVVQPTGVVAFLEDLRRTV